MKIIFMGTPDFAVPTLKKLISSKHEIVAVYTQKPKAANRGLQIQKSKIHLVAEENNLKILTPETLKDEESQAYFKNLSADIAVVAAYGMLLPKPILTGVKFGCINIHPSKLPRWRGAAPLQRTLIEGDKSSAICIMKMDENLDTGDIILQKDFAIPEEWNLENLHNFCAEEGADLTLQTLDLIEKNLVVYNKQSEHGVTYAKKIKKEDEKINFDKNGDEIINLIRGLSPIIGAYFMHNNLKHKIFSAKFLNVNFDKNLDEELKQNFAKFSNGQVVNKKFYIKCNNGYIQPLLIQKEGKKRMPIEEFIKGN